MTDRGQTMTHTCHADHCSRAVPPRMLMCRAHWRMVPKLLQDAVWATYREGQEIDKQPTAEYLAAAHAAIDAVAEWERSLPVPKLKPAYRCPACADGHLQEKYNTKTGHKFMACDNFVAKPSDSYPQGIGCQHTQEIPEYVRLLRAGAQQLPGF